MIIYQCLFNWHDCTLNSLSIKSLYISYVVLLYLFLLLCWFVFQQFLWLHWTKQEYNTRPSKHIISTPKKIVLNHAITYFLLLKIYNCCLAATGKLWATVKEQPHLPDVNHCILFSCRTSKIQEPRKEVGSLSPVERSMGLSWEPSDFCITTYLTYWAILS